MDMENFKIRAVG